MPAIKPIETRYAGCRFRSRLEARWAVFFDHLGIAWEYEREGYTVSDRLYLTEHPSDQWHYLPDFWLPSYGLHIEVKGSLDPSNLRRLLSAAAYLSAPNGGCGDGADTLILGPIPLPQADSHWPFRLHMHKGDLQISPFKGYAPFLPKRCWDSITIADDTGTLHTYPESITRLLLNGHPTDQLRNSFISGYQAARSARFEHGEQG